MKFNNILLQFLGVILISTYIWVRFIRQRLPRDIPFNLSLTGFIALFVICCTYIYIIYKIFKPNTSNKYIQYFYPMLKIVLDALQQINAKILSKKPLLFLLRTFLVLLQKVFKHSLIIRDNESIYVIAFVLPKILLTLCLIIDCFYFKQLNLFYNAIVVVTFPLVIQYLLYITPVIQKHYTDLLDKYFIVEITSTDIVYKEEDYDDEGFLKHHLPRHAIEPSEIEYYRFYKDFENIDPYINLPKYNYLQIAEFIDYQSSALYSISIPYEYKVLFHDERQDTPTAKDISRHPKQTKAYCEKSIQLYIDIALLKDHISLTKDFYKKNYKNLTIQNIDIFLNLVILSCWAYILVKSIHTLPGNLDGLKDFITVCDQVVWLLTKKPTSITRIKISAIIIIMTIHYFYRKQ